MAHSPQLFAQASTPEVAAPKAASVVAAPRQATETATEAPAPAAEPASVEATEEEASEAPAPTKYDIGASRVEGELKKVVAEREGYSRALPWLTLSAGAAMTVGGVAAGARYVYSCDGDCATPAWIGILVVTGTFFATIGTIWVVNANADVRELDSKRYHLEQELDRIKYSANLPNKSELQRSQLLSMRFAFR